MKTTPVALADLTASVIAVPPLCRDRDLAFSRTANQALIRHLESGGVTTLMYGGNANFYGVGLYEYAAAVDALAEIAAPTSWVIPSIGADFGKMLDQVAVLRTRAFPTAMVLPMASPTSPEGVEAGIRRVADAYGKPIVVYIKADGYIAPEGVKRLVEAGAVSFVKYGTVRKDPGDDPFLARLVEIVDRRLVVSGIGERPAIAHLRDFGLAGFTSGSVCVAPRGSMAMLAALKRRDYAAAERVRAAYIPLEDCRDRWSPIPVLHEAVRLAGIADSGPILPMLANLDRELHEPVAKAARELLAFDRSLAAQAA